MTGEATLEIRRRKKSKTVKTDYRERRGVDDDLTSTQSRGTLRKK